MGKLDDKVAIVTGASSGMGEATAELFAVEGAHVVVAARRTERLRELERRIVSAGGTVLVVATDMADQNQVLALIERARAEFGRIDILVNNAGLMPNAAVAKANVSDWRQMVEVNFFSLMVACQAVLPIMKAQGSGDIVNVSSVAAITAPPTGAAYSATKAAVRTFSEALRKETGRHGTRVTCIYPGLVETELFDGIPSAAARDALKTRMAQVTPLQAIDLANAILFVVSQPRHAAIHELVMRPSTQDF